MGIALHAYQDSWSHETYGPIVGHASAQYNGHYPDITAFPDNLEKAMEMAKATYEKLAKLAKDEYGCEPKKWEDMKDIQDEIRGLFSKFGSDPGPYTRRSPGIYIGADEELYKRDRALRNRRWVEAIEPRFHLKNFPGFTSADDNDEWAKDFLRAANDPIFRDRDKKGIGGN
jgi:hypothetical protein